MFFNKKAKLLEKAEEELLAARIELQAARQSEKFLLDKYMPIVDLDQAAQERQTRVSELETKFKALESSFQNGLVVMGNLEKKIALYQESLDLTEYGLYIQKYNFEYPEQYKVELESVYQRQKEMVSAGTAAICKTTWTVGGSAAEGKKMVKNQTKLMLYAFNGECDAQIAGIRWNNVAKVEDRIRQAFVNISRLGSTQQITLSPTYLELKLQEMALNYEYQLRKYEDKEEQRRIREQMREEEKAQRDFERVQKEAEDEERRFQRALQKARKELTENENAANMEALQQSVKALEHKLQEAQQQKERAISMAQQTKVGHIYIISNIGSFGEDVYKIGMTRRLDPHDRVRELSDASVPFLFDIHATIHSENAPQLEYDLHQQFKNRRLNLVNMRKEFFKVPLEEIEDFVLKHTGATITFTRLAEAREFRQTCAIIESLTRAAEKDETKADFPTTLTGSFTEN